MDKNIHKFIFLFLIIISGCSLNNDKKPKIAIAGLAIESSTFSPAITEEKAFHAKTDNDVFLYYPFLSKDSILRERINWIPTLRGHALPGGIVTKEAYESLVSKTLDKLKKNMPYDGLFFDIHGAMSVQGLDDPEGNFITRIRKVIGNKTFISTSMDLHGNVSKILAEKTDLITCYRMAPHEDAIELKELKAEKVNLNIKPGFPFLFYFQEKKLVQELNLPKVFIQKLNH